MRPSWRRATLWLLFLTAVAVSAHDWSFLAGDTRRQFRLDEHRMIVEHTARPPNQYRVLVPYALEPLIRTAARFMPYEDAFGRVYAVFYLAALAAMLYALFAYLRLFFTDEQALVGSLVPAATMPMALRAYDYAPYSQLEPTFFAIALILIYGQRHAWLALLVAVATLNRETGIFLVALFAVAYPLTRERVRWSAAYVTIWAGVFVGLRLLVGEGPPRYWTLDMVWFGNTHSLEQIVYGVVNMTLLYGAFWLFALLGLKHAPAFAQRTALVIPPYLVIVGAWGVWTEARLLQPLYPLIIPLGLAFIFPRERE